MMLYQARNIGIIFQDAYGLTQLVLPNVRAAQDTPALRRRVGTARMRLAYPKPA
jgi:hypothetical protein